MSKVKIIYWSGTGNTQKMAEAVESVIANGEPSENVVSELKALGRALV